MLCHATKARRFRAEADEKATKEVQALNTRRAEVLTKLESVGLRVSRLRSSDHKKM
jgi:hypothetical protein